MDSTSFCCPLAVFSRLRQLNIPIFLLFGHGCLHTSPYKLRSHPPPNIESLALYTANAGDTEGYVQNISLELKNILSENLDIPANHRLRSILFDKADMFSISNELMRAARAKGIGHQSDGDRYLFYGGIQTSFVRSTD
ncbi:hypothetical protein BDW62DRAFT_198594 [Aspergillus aurantiobrunneus]